MPLKPYFYRAMYDWLHYFCGEWESWALVNRFNHTSGVTAVTPTDRPKTVRNRCVIEVFDGVFNVVTLLFGLSCGCRGFCYRTESDLFLFLFYFTLFMLWIFSTQRYIQICPLSYDRWTASMLQWKRVLIIASEIVKRSWSLSRRF